MSPLGKIRRATEAARADLLSTEEARRSVILTLVTAVANSYVNLRDLDKTTGPDDRDGSELQGKLRSFQSSLQVRDCLGNRGQTGTSPI